MSEQAPPSSANYLVTICAVISTALALFFLTPTAIILDLIRKPFPKMLYGTYWLLFFVALTALSLGIEYSEPHVRLFLRRFRTGSKIFFSPKH